MRLDFWFQMTDREDINEFFIFFLFSVSSLSLSVSHIIILVTAAFNKMKIVYNYGMDVLGLSQFRKLLVSL